MAGGVTQTGLTRSPAWLRLCVSIAPTVLPVFLVGCTVNHYHFAPAQASAPAERTALAVPVQGPPDQRRPSSSAPTSAQLPVVEPVRSAAPATVPPVPSTGSSPPMEEVVWQRAGPEVNSVGFQPPAKDPNPAGPPAAQPLPPPRPVPEVPLGQPRPVEPPTGTDQPGQAVPVRLTLDQVINAVLVSDPKLRSGFEAINQASADALTASLRPNPTALADVQLLPLTRPFTVTQQGGPPQQDVQLGWPIDWFLFGKRAANMAATRLGVKVSETDFADRVRQRVTDSVTGFYDVLEAKNLLDLARQDVTNLRRVEAVLQKGVDAGGKAVIDLNRVRLDRLRAEQTVRDAETTLVSAKAKLRAMIGRSDSDPAFDVEGALDAPFTAAPPSSEEGFALAVQNRPDIQSLRWKGEQTRANVLVEKRNAFPSVTPALLYTRQYQEKAIGFPDASSWGASMTVTLPVFDRNQGNRAKAASLLVQNQFDYRAALADLRAEVESAAQELRAARANAESISTEQLKLAREVLESITTAYQAGGRPLLDFLDAERNFRDTYRAYISARAAYWRAVYRYGAAIGQKIVP